MTGNQVSVWIAGLGMWPLIVVLVPNLLFRRYGTGGGKKRMASLYHALTVFGITTVASLAAQRELTDLYLYGSILLAAIVLYVFRSRVFPYRLACPECGSRLDMKTIYFVDSHLCGECRAKNTESPQ